MIQLSEPITLDKLLPLIEKLSKVEREQLKKTLETDPVSWETEWERVVSPFRAAFAPFPEEEVEQDLAEALAEVRRERSRGCGLRTGKDLTT